MIEYLTGFYIASKHAGRKCTGAVLSVSNTTLGECLFNKKMHSYYTFAVRVGTVNKAAISKVMIRYKDKACTIFSDTLRHSQLVEHYKKGCDAETNVKYTYKAK